MEDLAPYGSANKCESCKTLIVEGICGCNIEFKHISEPPVDATLLSRLDQFIGWSAPSQPTMTGIENDWIHNGYTVIPGLIGDDLIEPYLKLRSPMPDIGWSAGTPYMQHPEIRNICCNDYLSDVLKRIIGDEMGLHLNLTGWVSTRRAMHQDDYLNPPFINSWYAGVWIALEDIHPDSGPFEMYPGSHRMDFVRMSKVMKYVPVELRTGSDWVYFSEPWVSKAIENECLKMGLTKIQYLPKKGDVMIWHSRLAHTGSVPNNPLLKRKSLIAHYSALTKRTDMPHRARNEYPGSQGYYFML